MIDHIVLFQLKEGVTEADVDALTDALYDVARIADGVVSYRLSRDAGLRDGNEDLALVAQFRDEAAFRAYLTHPRHLAVLADSAPRLFAGKHSVQLVTSSA